MKKEYEQEYIEIEKMHPWFVARRKLVFDFLKKIPKTAKILDVGCGSGHTIQYLKSKGFENIIGIDNSSTFVDKYAYVADATYIPFKKESFDVVLCLDVLEHMKDDSLVSSAILNVLKKEGVLILTVPAFNFLWNNHDIINNHFRRYNSIEVKSLFNNGVRTVKLTYWNSILFIPTLFLKLTNKHNKKNTLSHDFIKFPKLIYHIILTILLAENFLIRYVSLPIGTSVVGVFKKN